MTGGYWLDRWGGDIEAAMIEAQPEALIVGIAAWNDIPRMLAVLPSLKLLSLRDTRKPLLNREPEDVVGEISSAIYAIALGNARAQAVCVVHGLDEEHSDIDRAVAWELRAAAHAHALGHRYYGWHVTYGLFDNAESQRFRSVWDACDLIGRHAYIGHVFTPNPGSELQEGQEAPWSETVLRPEKWDDFPWHKWLASEAGYDLWDSTYSGEGSPGWQVMQRENGQALTELEVADRFLQAVAAVQLRGGIGLIWYCHAAQNEAEWSNYYDTKAMRDYWRGWLPSMRWPIINQPTTELPNENHSEAGVTMPIVDPATRFPNDFEAWKASGGIPNIDFLAWQAVVNGYQLTAEEYRAIANAIKGNAEALMLLPSPPNP